MTIQTDCPQCALDIDAVVCQLHHLGRGDGSQRWLHLMMEHSPDWEVIIPCDPGSQAAAQARVILTAWLGSYLDVPEIAGAVDTLVAFFAAESTTPKEDEQAEDAAIDCDIRWQYLT